MTTNESDIKVLGINSDRDTCDCCGKTNLAKVVWLEIDGGEPVAYGVNCAAKAKLGRPQKKGDDMIFRRMARGPVARALQVCVQPPSLGEALA